MKKYRKPNILKFKIFRSKKHGDLGTFFGSHGKSFFDKPWRMESYYKHGTPASFIWSDMLKERRKKYGL